MIAQVVALLGALIGAGLMPLVPTGRRPIALAVLTAWTAVVTSALGVAVVPSRGLLAGSLTLLVWRAWWRRQPQRLGLDRFDRRTRRSIVLAEMAGRPLLLVTSVVLGWGLGGAVEWGLTGQVLVGVAVGAVAAVSIGDAAVTIPNPEVVLPQTSIAVLGPGVSVADVVAAVGDRTVSIASSPPRLYRGLAGWNLGLGLDAESAAWAGQLANSLGLSPILADPAPLVSPADARKITVCRALAAPAEVVVLEEPTAGLDAREVRDLARVARRSLGDRAMVLVVADERSVGSFVAKVRPLD